MSISKEDLAELVSLAEGYEASAYAEGKLYDALSPERAGFHAGDRDTHTMRQLRISNDARAAVQTATRSAKALRAAIALLEVTHA